MYDSTGRLSDEVEEKAERCGMKRFKEPLLRLILSLIAGQCDSFAWLGIGLLFGERIHPKDLTWTIKLFFAFGLVGGATIGVVSALERVCTAHAWTSRTAANGSIVEMVL